MCVDIDSTVNKKCSIVLRSHKSDDVVSAIVDLHITGDGGGCSLIIGIIRDNRVSINLKESLEHHF